MKRRNFFKSLTAVAAVPILPEKSTSSTDNDLIELLNKISKLPYDKQVKLGLNVIYRLPTDKQIETIKILNNKR